MAMIKRLKLLIVFFVGCLSTLYFLPLEAANTCDKIVIAGEPGWPPYSYFKDGQMQGVGFDLAKKLVAELDLPVEVQEINSLSDLEHMLQRGHVDLLVATYDIIRYRDLVHLISPGYFEDVVSIIAPKSNQMVFREWLDLMGYNGITSYNTQLGEAFTNFAQSYLNIRSEGSLEGLFKHLDNYTQDYVIGSAQFLKIGMMRYGQDDKLEFLPQSVSAQEVFFGIAVGSGCLVYAPFFKARMAALVQDQRLIDALLKEHGAE
ncbi:MAG TPA: transporter substrate-binding domain-containing protein [Gammaproteobacteria bacterium]|nr:transporter substrate-binding domain-containing protein [Gammaproteobacteria bacterium]